MKIKEDGDLRNIYIENIDENPILVIKFNNKIQNRYEFSITQKEVKIIIDRLIKDYRRLQSLNPYFKDLKINGE